MRGSFKKYVRSLKSELKQTGGGGSSLSVRSLCEKNYVIFTQQAKFSQISCLAVAKCFFVLSLVQHIKVFFYSKGVDFVSIPDVLFKITTY